MQTFHERAMNAQMLSALESVHSMLCSIPSVDLATDFARRNVMAAIHEASAAIVETTGKAPRKLRLKLSKSRQQNESGK
jgi:hypothetical protein